MPRKVEKKLLQKGLTYINNKKKIKKLSSILKELILLDIHYTFLAI